ncbi:MAG: hypothetical protein EU532_02535 [Promethearchaeota archaeon]|nr:MAG: hypothetical protein EU532_02535 [Candidatus Lokiarchaeota archaeon]
MLDPIQIINNWVLTIIYLFLGYIALIYFEKIAGFPGMLDKEINMNKRVLIPFFFGLIFGISAILFDLFNPIKVPQLPFPISIPYWIFLGITDEIFWRLFLLTFLIWLISYKLLNDNRQEQVFWGVAIFESIIYIIIQLILFSSFVGIITFLVLLQIIIISGGYIIIACYCYRKGGFLAVLVLRLTQYTVYHIIYGSLTFIL